MRFVTSRYNFRIPLADGWALFNASSGAVLRLAGPDAADLAVLLGGSLREVSAQELGQLLTEQLTRGGFVVPDGHDELEAVRDRYWKARNSAPVTLVVTVTMDCNLACYYCYESRTSDSLRATNVDQVVGLARERLERSRRQILHLDWYGGEPLLNIDFIEEASLALQRLCSKLGARYSASVISNGTRWPEDLRDFVDRHRIRQVQISFDGLAPNHDRRRRYRPTHRTDDDVSSFAQAVDLVGQLLRYTRVDVRFNVDHGNSGDLEGFVKYAGELGWFDAPHRCVVMPAKLAAYSEHSGFMRRRELSPAEFQAVEARSRTVLPLVAQDNQDVVRGFPYPRTSVCGALARNSAVIGADGLEYRCGLQVGEDGRAVGNLWSQVPDPAQDSYPDRNWWEEFDPTRQPSCASCSFLPVCMGGCPKRHLENSRVDLDTESIFWRRNLPRMIAQGFREELTEGFEFSENDQFRDRCDGSVVPRQGTPWQSAP